MGSSFETCITYADKVMGSCQYTPLANYAACQATTVYHGVARQGPAGAIGSIFPSVQETLCDELGTAA